MSGWWLLLIVPVSSTIGLLAAGMFNARSYDRGWHDGHGRGWCEAWIAATTDDPDTTT